VIGLICSTGTIGARSTYFTLPGAAVPLLSGAWLAVTPKSHRTDNLVIPAVSVAAVAAVVARWTDPVALIVTVIVVSAATVTVLNLTLTMPGHALSRALASRWMAWLGTRSYSLYLWHLPIFALGAHHGPIREWWATWVEAFIAAELSTRLIEVPCRAWLSHSRLQSRGISRLRSLARCKLWTPGG
jgi:peptidoglycan/LPS O-acetylase OafA/YrhL